MKKEKLLLLEKQDELRRGLPFIYGWKWYPWARAFFESTNKINLLCAANQISKSSTMIRKCSDWATNVPKWGSLWGHRPTQFWYLYPSNKQVEVEFETKWKQFLPSGVYKEDPVYGWDAQHKNGELFALHFNSGVHLYFKTYSQKLTALQAGTVDAIFADEECPTDLYDELIFRISASSGYFHMAFTATLGQEFWRKAMEPGPHEKENLPDAFKQTVSMYDCLKYEDGTDSHWTLEKIQEIKNRCKSDAEVQRRVYGRFVRDTGLKYPTFNVRNHVRPAPKGLKGKPNPGYNVYAGSDPGSGGDTGHPGALCFVCVDPTYRKARVFLGYRGDKVDTTSGDLVHKYIDLKKEGGFEVVDARYDFANKDFYNIATRMGVPFSKADKGKKGEEVINVLFKNDMLFVDDDPELQKLVGEFLSLTHDTPKTKARDDFIDALRYAVATIPWDWSIITGEKPDGWEPDEPILSTEEQGIKDRRDQWDATLAAERRLAEDELAQEYAEWNEAYGSW